MLRLFGKRSTQKVVKEHRSEYQRKIDNIPPTVKKERRSYQKPLTRLSESFGIEIEIDKKGDRQE